MDTCPEDCPKGRPLFWHTMEELAALIDDEKVQDDFGARSEWIQRFGYFYPKIGKTETFKGAK